MILFNLPSQLPRSYSKSRVTLHSYMENDKVVALNFKFFAFINRVLI